MMEVMVTTRAINCAKLQSDHHHQHPVFLQAGCPSCRITNNVKALKGKLQINLGFFSVLAFNIWDDSLLFIV